MTEKQTDISEQDGNISPLASPPSSTPTSTPTSRVSLVSARFLDRADTLIYVAVGVCLMLGAIFTLLYGIWNFISLIMVISTQHAETQLELVASAILELISSLLLVLIITEVLGTIIYYLKAHVTSIRPFLFIGIISATRVILALGAKLLTIKQPAGPDFNAAMIELGVTAGVVIALAIAIKLVADRSEFGPDG